MTPLPLLQQREIEAKIVGPLFRAFAAEVGEERAREILANVVRDLGRDRRDVNRERSLEAAAAESSARLEAWLAAEQSSPSQQAERNEQALRLADALTQLPEAQREVVLLRHCHGWSLADISRQLGRSPSAVAGLLHRGLRQLRALLEEAG